MDGEVGGARLVEQVDDSVAADGTCARLYAQRSSAGRIEHVRGKRCTSDYHLPHVIQDTRRSSRAGLEARPQVLLTSPRIEQSQISRPANAVQVCCVRVYRVRRVSSVVDDQGRAAVQRHAAGQRCGRRHRLSADLELLQACTESGVWMSG